MKINSWVFIQGIVIIIMLWYLSIPIVKSFENALGRDYDSKFPKTLNVFSEFQQSQWTEIKFKTLVNTLCFENKNDEICSYKAKAFLNCNVWTTEKSWEYITSKYNKLTYWQTVWLASQVETKEESEVLSKKCEDMFAQSKLELNSQTWSNTISEKFDTFVQFNQNK